jgi:hypothetical protein
MNRHQVVRLPARLRKSSLQTLVERFHVLHPPVLARPHFAQVTAEFNEPGIPLDVLLLFQARISSILVSTNRARRRLNFGSMGGLLVSKLVKPTKVFGSWPTHQSGIDQLLFP